MTARIAPGTRRELGFPIWGFSRLAGRVTKTAPPAIFTTLGRGRGLFWGWLFFAGQLMPGGKLPRRETELVILRVATLRGCTYEFEHHVRIGRRAGVTAADPDQLPQGGERQVLLRPTDHEEGAPVLDLSQEPPHTEVPIRDPHLAGVELP